MTDLENNLRKILYEKNVKIIPENIKEGIDIFGIEGIIPSDITTFEDYKNCMIIANSITDNINPEKILSEATYSYTEGEDFTDIAPIDTGVPQSDLVNGYTLFGIIKPTAWANSYGLCGRHINNGGLLLQYDVGGIVYGHFKSGFSITIPVSDLPLNIFSTLTVKFYIVDGEYFLDVYINGQKKWSQGFGELIPRENFILGNSLSNEKNRQFHGIINCFYLFDHSLNELEINKVNNYLLEQTKEV